jgi:hypothetical protein
MPVYPSGTATLTDAGTIYSSPVESSSSRGTLTLQASFENVSGTTAGTATFEGSIDGVNYKTISTVAGKFDFYASASEAISDGLVMQAAITNSPFGFYRFKVVGSGTQSTTCTFSFYPKRD